MPRFFLTLGAKGNFRTVEEKDVEAETLAEAIAIVEARNPGMLVHTAKGTEFHENNDDAEGTWMSTYRPANQPS